MLNLLNLPQHNVHKILPDEPSESAERWLRELTPRALLDTDIPFIDSEAEEDLESREEKGVPGMKMRKSLTFSDNISFKRQVFLIQSEVCNIFVMFRAESVVAQAEARRVEKRRNSIKKRMMTQLGKSIENLSLKDGNRLKVQKSCSVIEPLSKETVEPRKEIGSLSDVGFAQLATVKFRGKEKRKPAEKKIKKKKDLIKNWQQNYDEMCDRAQKLDLAIKMAEMEEMEIRPVNQFNSVSEKNEKWRHKMLDRGSFYSLHSAASSDTFVLEDVEQVVRDKFSSLEYLPSLKEARQQAFKQRSISFHGFKK